MVDPNIPTGPLQDKWTNYRRNVRLVSPANKKKFTVLVVGSGLAGSSAASSLAELGYNVKIFCIQDSPRRAHSIAAQGGINAAKNYPNDGDSVERLFQDTIKGGDFRSREANVYRLAEISNAIIDQCVAQGVPFAREYSGYLANRSFGGAQVSRTFYARGQTGQQLLLGAYGALMKEVAKGTVEMHPRCEMLDIVVIKGVTKGIIVRDLLTGKMESYVGDAVVLATGGYSTAYYLSTNAKACNVTAAWRAHKKGAYFANPCFTQIHPTCIPAHGDYQSKLTLMSESLRNDGRIWVPVKSEDDRHPNQIPDEERDYFLERKYPSYGNLVPRDIAARSVKELCDAGNGVGPTGYAVYLDFRDSIQETGMGRIFDRYGNLFQMYTKITGTDPYIEPMMIYPAPHYTMGGLWVDYNLMSNLQGLFVIGEANFSDHGANRLGASALMQGLADGYFILPYTIGDYLAGVEPQDPERMLSQPEFKESEAKITQRIHRLLAVNGTEPADYFHRKLGKALWDKCGMSRSAKGLKEVLMDVAKVREEFWAKIKVPGSAEDFNMSLEKTGRVADFLEFADLMIKDAIHREESCGGHFREEHQTENGEAKRNDKDFSYVAAWEFSGVGRESTLHKEVLKFENIKVATRDYK